MRLLYNDGNDTLNTEECQREFPEYVILSHTWLTAEDEVKYEDVIWGCAMQKPASYRKIQFCSKQASIDGYRYFWIDTCCIDRSSSSEVQEAITSMFRWYRDASKCYAYLADVSVKQGEGELPHLQRSWEEAFRQSRWFTRGWTLQELLAPTTVEFYSAEGIFLGDKKSLKHILHEITAIPLEALEGGDLSRFTVSERLSWAKFRQTTRVEDQAYCLLGIFDIYMPLIYGEDEHAMLRLLQEVEKKHGEHAEWERLLDSLPIAPQAAFNSLDNQYGPSCLANTRIELLKDLINWANSKDGRCIYWLNGIAGTGKSTVARTVARKFHEDGILGGSFFFSRGGGDVGHANLLFTTLASQLAGRVPSVKRHICEAITQNKDIALHSLRDQWDKLIIEPLARINDFGTNNIIFVLDALDECDNEGDVRIILRLISTARTVRSLRLRVLVTSRPEIPIRCGFLQIPEAERQVFLLHDIMPTLVDRDLNLFLQHNLAAIGEERGFAADWPGSDIIARLVQIACGLFIWASTACRYIRDGKRFAVKRLETLIRGHHSGVGPEKQLDAIYTTVLEGLIQQDFEQEEKEMMCEIINEVVGGIVTLFSPLPIEALANLLDRRVHEIDETLADLHTIFHIPDAKSRPVRLHHPTFRDFLVDQTRCKNADFWVDQKLAHKALADNCIRIMRKMLKRDICGLKAPGTLMADVDKSLVQQCIPSELRYACLYWVQHYRQSGALLGEQDTAYHFLKEHYLHWLEAMNLMGKSSEISAIIRMYQALLVDQHNARQLSFLKDARRFFFSFQTVMERAPLQIYCAGLVFVRPSNELKSHFWHERHSWLQRVHAVDAIAPESKDEYMYVNDIAFTPDGKRVASASIGPVIRIWDLESKDALFVYKGQRDKTGTVAISPDGKNIASGSDDASVMVWDVEARVMLFNLEGHTRWVNTVVYSPDGKVIASGSMDETIRLWNAASGAELNVLEGNLSCINSIAFSPDGRLLVSATSDWLVRIWIVSRAEVQLILDGHSGPVNTVRFSADGGRILSGSDDMTIKVWDATTGAPSITLRGHAKKVSAAIFSPDACIIVSGSEDKTVRLWDAQNGVLLSILEGHTSGINAVCYSPDGRTLAAGAYNDEIRLWNAATGEAQGKLTDFTIEQLEAISDEKDTSGVTETDVLPVERPRAHAGAVHCLILSPDRQIVASGSQDFRVKLWTKDGSLHAELAGHSGRITCLIFHPNSHMLASGSVDSTIILWDVSTGIQLNSLQGHSSTVQDVQFSPDGNLLASCSTDKTIRLWHTFSGAATGPLLQGHTDTVIGIAFSPDGVHLVSGSADNTVRLWNVRTAKMATIPFLGHTDTVTCVTFSPAGDLIASCSLDSSIILWNVTDIVAHTSSGAPHGSARGIAYGTATDTGSSIVARGLGGTANDISSGISGVPSTRISGEHLKGINSVAFSLDGKQLVASANDHTVRIWKCDTRVELASIDIATILQKIRFNGSHLIVSDRGALVIDSSILDISLLSIEEDNCTSFATDEWVMRDGRNALWLPDEYRAISVVADGSFTALGHSSGAITFIFLK